MIVLVEHVFGLNAVSPEFCVTADLRALQNRAGAQMVTQMRTAKTPFGLTDCRSRTLAVAILAESVSVVSGNRTRDAAIPDKHQIESVASSQR